MPALRDLELRGLGELEAQLPAILAHAALTRLVLRAADLRDAPGGAGGALQLAALRGSLRCLDLHGSAPPPGTLDAIAQLTGLTSLNLGGIDEFGTMALLPPAFSALSSLRSLVLRRNFDIESLAPLGAMSALTELDLCSAELATLPPALSALTNLQRLNLANNGWLARESLRDLAPLASCLTELNLAWLEGQEVPPALALLTRLRDLNLTCMPSRPLRGGAEHLRPLTGEVDGLEDTEITFACVYGQAWTGGHTMRCGHVQGGG